jgi:catechol 2,3-dioxygenase-like lactoylglutathione lyase family enzyme
MSVKPAIWAPSRRAVWAGLGAAALTGLASRAQQGPGGPPPTPEAIAAALPIRSPGVDHIAMTVPDVTVSARFYSKLFAPDGLHKEQEGDLRYYVWLDNGYIAIGGREPPIPPVMDHFCTTVEGYDGRAMAARLADEGLPQGRFGVFPDPNGIGFQLLSVPGGLATTTEPTTRIVNGDALVTTMGLVQVRLLVDDIDQTVEFYRAFFGFDAARSGEPERAVFTVAATELIIERRPPAEPPRIDEFGVRVAPFDRAALEAELRVIGASIVPDAGDGILRLRDPYGLGVALIPADVRPDLSPVPA